MGGDSLDARLQPIAQFLLILILLVAVAAITAYVLSKYVQRKREQAHGKLSASRRGKHTKIDLFAKDGAAKSSRHRSGKRRRGGHSEDLKIDILKRPEAPTTTEEGPPS